MVQAVVMFPDCPKIRRAAKMTITEYFISFFLKFIIIIGGLIVGFKSKIRQENLNFFQFLINK